MLDFKNTLLVIRWSALSVLCRLLQIIYKNGLYKNDGIFSNFEVEKYIFLEPRPGKFLLLVLFVSPRIYELL